MNPNDEKLAAFVEDTVTFYAVKSILFSKFDANKLVDIPSRGDRESALQAVFDGRILLENGFKELLKYKKDPEIGNKDINSFV